MGVCTAFVFAALVEFTFVNYMWRSPSILEGKRKNYAERHMMEKQRQLKKKSNPNNSFFPCLERQDSSIELNMVSMICYMSKHQNKTVCKLPELLQYDNQYQIVSGKKHDLILSCSIQKWCFGTKSAKCIII